MRTIRIKVSMKTKINTIDIFSYPAKNRYFCNFKMSTCVILKLTSSIERFTQINEMNRSVFNSFLTIFNRSSMSLKISAYELFLFQIDCCFRNINFILKFRRLHRIQKYISI